VQPEHRTRRTVRLVASDGPPATVRAISFGVMLMALCIGLLAILQPEGVLRFLGIGPGTWPNVLGILTAVGLFPLAVALWRQRDWARAVLMVLLGAMVVWQVGVVLLAMAAEIFAGTRVVPIRDVAHILILGLWRLARAAGWPTALLYCLA